MDKLTSSTNEYSQQLINLTWVWGPKIITAILVLIIGLWVIGIITRVVGKGMEKRRVDSSLSPFVKSLVGALLKIVLIISVIG
ncbi:MAG: hypothetical protein OXH57_05855, partial [Ekhidna sp.]|nr:hypothetical protein [Ekhidna sp.]